MPMEGAAGGNANAIFTGMSALVISAAAFLVCCLLPCAVCLCLRRRRGGKAETPAVVAKAESVCVASPKRLDKAIETVLRAQKDQHENPGLPKLAAAARRTDTDVEQGETMA